jgi:thymidylate synthase ThyX
VKTFVVDDLNPEDLAMLQALYSRSAASVEEHLEKVKKTGSGKFMSQYYVNYGHKSIADCGSTTMFIEGVSLLAAKAIQDWPLYSGQETSTRYIDMSKQVIVDPIGTPESQTVLDRWMAFYTGKQDAVGQILRARYPKRDDEKQTSYDGAIKARTFDILRGFLPAGITTQLSWHTNLRQAGDHLNHLVHHPLSYEIGQLGEHLIEQLAARYPSSGFALSMASVSGEGNKNVEARQARVAWDAQVADEFTYAARIEDPPFLGVFMKFNLDVAACYTEMLKTRPRGCVLPHILTDLGQVRADFFLDFGSFRDLQRHRNGVCRMPLLDANYGFEAWYLEQLGELRGEAEALIDTQRDAIAKLAVDDDDCTVVRQYYTALGFRVPCNVTYSLPALVYVLELRSGKTVHPTLRKQIHAMVHGLRSKYPDVALHVDMDPDDWTVRRGDQTITEKQS